MWLVPFKGRGFSGCYSQNFLWNKNNIYIMDNHRAALWCWFQHLSKDSKISYFHIDRHTDALESEIDGLVEACPDLWLIGIDDYLSKIYEKIMGDDVLLFRWDNYSSIFLKKYKDLVNDSFFVTHNEGDEPSFCDSQKKDVFSLANNLSYWLDDTNNQWIFNLDLDYFFYTSGYDEYSQLLSDEYIKQVFIAIKKLLDEDKILCLTICLSPEFCGSWEEAERVCSIGVRILGLDFILPKKYLNKL